MRNSGILIALVAFLFSFAAAAPVLTRSGKTSSISDVVDAIGLFCHHCGQIPTKEEAVAIVKESDSDEEQEMPEIQLVHIQCEIDAVTEKHRRFMNRRHRKIFESPAYPLVKGLVLDQIFHPNQDKLLAALEKLDSLDPTLSALFLWSLTLELASEGEGISEILSLILARYKDIRDKTFDVLVDEIVGSVVTRLSETKDLEKLLEIDWISGEILFQMAELTITHSLYDRTTLLANYVANHNPSRLWTKKQAKHILNLLEAHGQYNPDPRIGSMLMRCHNSLYNSL